MKINKKGYWENNNGVGHYFDATLYPALAVFLKINNIKGIVDFGCGMADYAKRLIDLGFIVDAYDGNPNTPQLTNGIGKTLDLSNTFDLNRTYDCVLSLEVGEHIPKEYESVFINNLCRHSNKFIILSWAIPGQGGDGHVNCQTNDYIVSQLEKRGFNYLKNQSVFIRHLATASWFNNTLMIFKK